MSTPLSATIYNCGVLSDNSIYMYINCRQNLVVSIGPVRLCQRQETMSAVQLVLLSVVILTCLQTGVAHDNDDSKLLLWQQYMLCCS